MLLLVVVFLLTASAQDHYFDAMFRSFDRNGDTFVSYEENKATFDKFDKNGDGTVTRTEYVNYISARQPCYIPGYAFNIYDSNDDNMLNDIDYKKIFDQADDDNDLRISHGEMYKYLSGILGAPGNRRANCNNG